MKLVTECKPRFVKLLCFNLISSLDVLLGRFTGLSHPARKNRSAVHWVETSSKPVPTGDSDDARALFVRLGRSVALGLCS